MADSFPRQQARTKNFSLGAPRSFRVSPDGNRIVFLRSQGPADPVTCLWAIDLRVTGPGEPDTGQPQAGPERLIADPARIGTGQRDEPPQERARRERSREQAGGVVTFATDESCAIAAFAVAGQVFAADLGPDGAPPRPVPSATPAIDPRPDPAGRHVAYVHDGALRITDLATGTDRKLIGPDTGEADHITFGLAEFIAAEEMNRQRGYWWAPDGSALLVARVDNAPIQRWHIADPANPGQPPTEVSYPSAGTPNALVRLIIVDLDGMSIPVHWDADAYPYLTKAGWDGPEPMIAVQTRDQRRMRLLTIDRASGATTVLREDSDPSWLEIVPGVPARLADGRIVWTVDADGARRLLVATPAELADGGATPVTPPGLHVREVLSVAGQAGGEADWTVLFAASGDDPTDIGVWRYGPGGLAPLAAGLADGLADDGPRASRPPAVQLAVRSAGTTVLTSRSMARPGVTTTVLRGARAVTEIASLAERPALPASRVELLRVGRRDIRAALVLPSWHEPGSPKLPVLMDPYGGPHAQRVLAAADMYLTSRWFAEQGFAVIVADGRGTPGRGTQWERAIAGDLSAAVLEDQVDALAAVAEHCAEHCASHVRADLNLNKVGIRGWSFGGYLAALAVLRRPDVFGAAVAGAPVTDWRLYDTHYTERYLGDPASNAQGYERISLLTDAHKLSRPLMLIHGLADDNVVVAHTLRLSSALLAAGRPHSVLPLSGVTHMASQEEVAENLLLLQLEFLQTALGLR
jgi:dipeptidyl-peptidase 4